MQDNISPELAPMIPQLIARSQKAPTIIESQNQEPYLEMSIEKRS